MEDFKVGDVVDIIAEKNKYTQLSGYVFISEVYETEVSITDGSRKLYLIKKSSIKLRDMRVEEEDILKQIGGTHYETPIQPIEFIEANGLGFHEANVIKYVTRYKNKNGLEDLKKARWYLDRLINNMEQDNEKTNN